MKFFLSLFKKDERYQARNILLRTPVVFAAEPYEIFFALALILAGITDIITPTASGPLYTRIPQFETRAWGAMLFIGGTLTLLGLFISSRSETVRATIAGRSTERTGQLCLAFASL